MLLTDVYTSRSVGLNFSKIESTTLTKLQFRNIKISTDIRDYNSDNKCFDKIRKYVEPESKVFILIPDQKHYIPLILSMIEGITQRLPFVVYFDIRSDPEYTKPYCKNLEYIKWKSAEATQLELTFDQI